MPDGNYSEETSLMATHEEATELSEIEAEFRRDRILETIRQNENGLKLEGLRWIHFSLTQADSSDFLRLGIAEKDYTKRLIAAKRIIEDLNLSKVNSISVFSRNAENLPNKEAQEAQKASQSLNQKDTTQDNQTQCAETKDIAHFIAQKSFILLTQEEFNRLETRPL